MLRKKCASTSGASLLLALLFLLLCGLTGSVVLTAASVSSGRLSNLKKNEQSYYTVSSAAKLLKKEITGEKYSRYQVFSEANQLLSEGYNTMPEKSMKEFIKKAADQIYETGSSYQDTWTIQTSDMAISKVTAQFSMDIQYNITIILSSGDTVCTLRIPAVLSENTEETRDDAQVLIGKKKGIRKTTTLTWTGGEIEKN